LDDRQAVALCLAGDKESFAHLIQAYQAPMLGLCLRMTGNRDDAADVAQQAFVKAYEHLETYDPLQPFRPWLFRIATNECISLLRRKRGAPVSVQDDQLEAVADPTPGAPTLTDLSEDRLRVREAVKSLPSSYRMVVVLYYFQELSYQAIAQQTGLPIGTIGTHLHRAKQMLKRTLQHEEVSADEPRQPRTTPAILGR
jgi:RNA polymerase sigma-70 factor (ECF subfamily)